VRPTLVGAVALLCLLTVEAHAKPRPGATGAQPPHDTNAPVDSPPETPRTPIPSITDDDLEAAFPEVTVSPHQTAPTTFALLDRFEGHGGADGGLQWEALGWFGGDLNRLWFKSDGGADVTGVDDAKLQMAFGRAVSRWWDVTVGLRQDLGDTSRSWLAVGLQGLAPYWFEVEATAFAGSAGRIGVRLAADYELLLTNRLILQPVVELDLYRNRADDIGALPSELETGLRLRYEIRRELAPYVGIEWLRRLHTPALVPWHADHDRRFVGGLRLWY